MIQLRREGFDQLLRSENCLLIPLVPRTKLPISGFPLKLAFEAKYDTTYSDLQRWQKLGLNRAIVLGAPSRNLFCLDFDDEDSAKKFFGSKWDSITHETFSTKTSRGFQLLFRDPQADFSKLPSKIEDKEKLNAELLIHHRLAACPLNIHPSGVVYQWLGCGKIYEKPGIVQAFLDRFESLGIQANSIPKRFNLNKIKEGVSEGSRHNAALSYSVYLLGRIKLDFDVVWFEIQRWNSLNKPPLPQKELENVVCSAMNYVTSNSSIQRDRETVCGI